MNEIDIAALYRRHGAMVKRRCLTLLRNEHQAEDAMQDVFVRLLQTSIELEDRGMTTLLYRIATQVSLNRIRGTKRKPEDRDEEVLFQIANEDDLERRAVFGNLLDRFFKDEHTSTRVLATMHFVDGLTLEEVAREAGMSASGVRKRLAALKARIAQEGSHDDAG